MPAVDELICVVILLVVAGITNDPEPVAVGLLLALTAVQAAACVAGQETPTLTAVLAGGVVGIAAAILFEWPWLTLLAPLGAALTRLGK